MRRRLIEATVESLAQEGYAGSSLSSIVRRAGVSRGAQVHHYPNKQALLLDAAEELLKNNYRQIGEALLGMPEGGDKLQAVVDTVWQQFFETAQFRAYCELLTAAQRDTALMTAMRTMVRRVFDLFSPASAHYFETRDSGTRSAELFLQLGFLLSGLALQADLLDNRAMIRAQVQLWVDLVRPQLRARKGVRTPPPRPGVWDQPLRNQLPAAAPARKRKA